MELAVNMENLEDKIKAGDQIKVETNIMMQKFEIALIKRYQDTHQEMYGFKDERQTMNIMRRKISNMIAQFKPDSPRIAPQPMVGGGMGLFA